MTAKRRILMAIQKARVPHSVVDEFRLSYTRSSFWSDSDGPIVFLGKKFELELILEVQEDVLKI